MHDVQPFQPDDTLNIDFLNMDCELNCSQRAGACVGHEAHQSGNATIACCFHRRQLQTGHDNACQHLPSVLGCWPKVGLQVSFYCQCLRQMLTSKIYLDDSFY